jgi:hypothetical protein
MLILDPTKYPNAAQGALGSKIHKKLMSCTGAKWKFVHRHKIIKLSAAFEFATSNAAQTKHSGIANPRTAKTNLNTFIVHYASNRCGCFV